MNDEQKTPGQSWQEVGAEFQALGESLAAAFRATWESEETRQHVHEMQTGLETMVNEIGQAIQEVSTSPEAHQVRDEVKKAAESARAAGEQAWKDAQPHLLSALRQLNTEVDKLVGRMEQRGKGSEAGGSEAGSE